MAFIQAASGMRLCATMLPLAHLSRKKRWHFAPLHSALHDIARLVEMMVCLPQRRDLPIFAALCRTERDEQHLVVVMVDDRLQLALQLDPLRRVQITFEYRILQVIAVVL